MTSSQYYPGRDFTTFSVEMRRVRVVEVSPKTEVSVEAEAYWLDIEDALPIVPSPIEFNARGWPGDQTEVKATLRHFPELARDFEDLTLQIISIWQGAECTKVETNAAEDDPNHKDWLSLAKRLVTKLVASPPPVPGRKADLRRWKATWKTSKGQWMQGKGYKEICDWLHRTHPDLGCSTETLVKIIRAGEVGLLDE